MLRRVYLHGKLREEFGPRFDLAVDSIPALIRLLDANFKGRFKAAMRGRQYRVIRGSLRRGTPITPDEVGMLLGDRSKAVHVVPVMAGSKGGGGKSGIAGVAMGVGLMASGGMLAPAFAAGSFGAMATGAMSSMGLSMALGGVAGILSPTPQVADNGYAAREAPDERPSFLFNGAINVIEQGGPTPLVYGRIRTGSTVISGSIEVEQIDD